MCMMLLLFIYEKLIFGMFLVTWAKTGNKELLNFQGDVWKEKHLRTQHKEHQMVLLKMMKSFTTTTHENFYEKTVNSVTKKFDIDYIIHNVTEVNRIR